MDNFGIQPHNQRGNTFGPPTQPYLPPKDHRRKAAVIALCIGAAVFTAILGGWIYRVNSASYRIRQGFVNLARELEGMKNPLAENLGAGELRQMLAEEGSHIDTRLNATFDSFLGEITLGVDTDCEQDRKAKEMSAATTLSIRNYEFGHVDLYGDEENLCFSVPELFLENMYIGNEDVKGQYNRSLWAELFGPAEGDDVSINLFSDAWIFGDEEGVVRAFLREYEPQLAECGRHMSVEKAGEDLYRVRFDELYFNELVRQVLYDYVDFTAVGREEAMGILSYFDVISVPDDVSFLLEINRANRIESIRMEQPLPLCKGKMSVYGDIYFLGGKQSIEKMQGKIEAKKDSQEVSVLWQVTQSLQQDVYRMESEAKCSFTEEGKTENRKLGWDLECDGRKNSFETELSTRTGNSEVSLAVEGGLSHIERGSRFDLELDEAVLCVDQEELLLIRGDIRLSPLSKRVQQNVKPRIAFFELTEQEWNNIGERLYREYGYLLDYFW